MTIEQLLRALEARLPELEWKMSSLPSTQFSNKSLPRGLFHSRMEANASTCISEIKADIQNLAIQNNQHSAYYLAQCIHRKINVLVTLCHLQASKPKIREAINFGVNLINTRQQWLQSLQNDIELLSAQQQSMYKLQQSHTDPNVLLNLQAELGEVEKRLVLAREAFSRATD
jgi:primosomal protein N''